VSGLSSVLEISQVHIQSGSTVPSSCAYLHCSLFKRVSEGKIVKPEKDLSTYESVQPPSEIRQNGQGHISCPSHHVSGSCGGSGIWLTSIGSSSKSMLGASSCRLCISASSSTSYKSLLILGTPSSFQ
jgi:hypothetical protein